MVQDLKDRTRIPVQAQHVAQGIWRIGPLDPKNNGATPWTSPFLIKGEERAAILEPGEAGAVPEMLDLIGELGVELDYIAYIISTHIHLHHVGAASALLEAIPTAKVVIHQRGVRHLVDPTQLNASTLKVWGQDSGCPQMPPIPEDRIWGVADGQIIDLGKRELEIIETPGHAPHHFSIFDRFTRTLFPGDATGTFHGGPGQDRRRPEIVPPLFDMDSAIESLRRLRALKPLALMAFGWNGASFSPDKTLEWYEEDLRAVERICLEGMKQKLRGAEIGQKVQEYYNSVGIKVLGETTGVPEGLSDESRGPVGLYSYLKKQDPSLEMPQ